MNQIKLDVIDAIKEIPDEEATSIEKLLEAVYTRYCVLEGIKDMENGNVMTMEELRTEIANWKWLCSYTYVKKFDIQKNLNLINFPKL